MTEIPCPTCGDLIPQTKLPRNSHCPKEDCRVKQKLAYNRSKRKKWYEDMKSDPEKHEAYKTYSREYMAKNGRSKKDYAAVKSDPEKYEAYKAKRRQQAANRLEKLKANPEKYEAHKAKSRQIAAIRRAKKKEVQAE